MFSKDFRDHVPVISRIHLDYDLTDQAYTFHLHKDETEIVCITEGSGTYMINHRQFPVEAGDLLCIEHGMLHAGASNPQDPMKRVVLVIRNPEWNDTINADYVISPTANPVTHHDPHLPYLQAALVELAQISQSPSGASSYGSAVLSSILICLRRQISHQEDFWQPPAPGNATDILDYIYSHYTENITLDSLSKHFYLSTGYISRLMQETYGISPINYLIDVRFSKAKNLLLNTNMCINDVSFSVGYDNPSHFNKLFVKRIGYTPGEYRILHKGGLPKK